MSSPNASAYIYLNGQITDDHGRIIAAQDAALADHTWFGISGHYFCPDTGSRIVSIGSSWYHFEEYWNYINERYGGDDVILEGYAGIWLSLFEGMKFSPLYQIPLLRSAEGLYVDRSVGSLVMRHLPMFSVDPDIIERDLARISRGENGWTRFDDADGTIGTWEDDVSTITEYSDLPDLVNEAIVTIGETFFNPIDLTEDD